MGTGAIYTLDIGVRCGFAYGRPGAYPHSGVKVLKKPGEPVAVAGWKLIEFLQGQFVAERPALVVKEKMLRFAALKSMGNGADGVLTTAGLHLIVEAMCLGFGVHCESVADSTIRKHFLGRANMGSREATKAAVIERAQLLKLMPSDSRDDNRADAIATWDYACHTFGRAAPRELHLFGESAT